MEEEVGAGISFETGKTTAVGVRGMGAGQCLPRTVIFISLVNVLNRPCSHLSDTTGQVKSVNASEVQGLLVIPC